MKIPLIDICCWIHQLENAIECMDDSSDEYTWTRNTLDGLYSVISSAEQIIEDAQDAPQTATDGADGPCGGELEG